MKTNKTGILDQSRQWWAETQRNSIFEHNFGFR